MSMKTHPVSTGVSPNCRSWGSKVAALNPMKFKVVAVASASRIVLQSAKNLQMLSDCVDGLSPGKYC